MAKSPCREIFGEDALDDWGGDGVTLESVQALTDRSLAGVWVRPSVCELVAVRRPATQESAFVLRLGLHAMRTRILIRLRSPFDMPP